MFAKEKLNLTPMRILAIVFFLILLIVFNATRRPYESEASREFQKVINVFEQQAKLSFEDGRSANRIAISVRSIADPAPFNLQIDNVSSGFNKDKTEQMVHLLNLIYESGIISGKQAASGEFLVHVEISNQIFEGSFRRGDVNAKMPLGIFLKLMQLDAHA